MTRYDKMYVPCHPKEMDAQVIGDRFADFVEIERNKIVLTIEELKEVWDAGMRAKYFENNSNAKYTDFKSWMEYKGIKTT